MLYIFIWYVQIKCQCWFRFEVADEFKSVYNWWIWRLKWRKIHFFFYIIVDYNWKNTIDSYFQIDRIFRKRKFHANSYLDSVCSVLMLLARFGRFRWCLFIEWKWQSSVTLASNWSTIFENQQKKISIAWCTKNTTRFFLANQA